MKKYNHNGFQMCYLRLSKAKKARRYRWNLSEISEDKGLEIPWAHSFMIFHLFPLVKHDFEGGKKVLEHFLF